MTSRKTEKNMSDIQVLIFSPASYATGGVELLHQLCSEIDKYDGIDAKMYYYNGQGNRNPQPEEYKKYNCRWQTEIGPNYDGVVIFPEILANSVTDPRYSKCKKVIFWESVDNYFKFCRPKDYFLFTREQDTIHLSQSYYASGFLLDIGIDSLYVGDYINEDFLEPYDEQKREPIVLYNPAKGMKFTQKIIEYVGNVVDFVPIRNMTRAEAIDLMRKSKAYIDFGDHPGKDRLPREAAMCGCCIITGRNGAAGNEFDIPIGDFNKFTRWEQSLPHIRNRIIDVVVNYDLNYTHYEEYRDTIRNERQRFEQSCWSFAEQLKRGTI